ncbi:hypothetical protein M8Q42_02835 [Enterobacter hormaechei]|uniref:hypothetical protein n=1 Tax=Enterobacter hormaechei TaxID=158836 RepID=UPI002075D60B|nr:hypothetical protein [Enterobacter hormaechei]HEO8956757.1 hypothetical protein [Enterobacter hormaechei subsp. steigerwaltii]MCM7201243.1 hypothetical protein [Enterobacter hormaechei]MEA5201058.1 hypothetical protein [Enterobacter hormaechei]WGA69167.1 hypothetical protein NFL05_14100 [Enterobacter hormaechei]WGA73653.1 hypothetical protein NFL06_14105 [Enterobacter hormaechei]
MADVVSEIKKHGSYTTKTAVEGKQAADLLAEGLVTITPAGSTLQNGKSVVRQNCLPTNKFHDFVKKGII